MSSGRFEERKARVAHQTPHNPLLLASLERKRQCLSTISGRLGGGTGSPVKKQTKVKKTKRNFVASDEEDDFIVEDESEGEGEFHLSDDEEPRKRKTPAAKSAKPGSRPSSSNGIAPTLKIKVGTETVTTSGKKHTLSESSEDEGWLCKPRLNGQSDPSTTKKMRTKVSEPKPKVQRKKIIMSDDSDCEEENMAVSESTLKKVAKSAAREKKKNGGEESEDEWADEGLDGGEGTDGERGYRDDTPSDDSDAEERKALRRSTHEDPISKKCREFFNSATQEELMATPRVTEKMALAVIGNRPFEKYGQLEACLSDVSRGRAALEAYQEYLENRGVLESILYDCKGHAAAVEKDYEQCTQNRFQPAILAEGYNLHEYQQIGLNWLIMMYRKGFNCILGDEMGLGKTIQIIAFLAWMKEQKIQGPHLVVVPSSTIENWMGEITKWCPSLKLLTYYGSQDERKQLRHIVKKKKATTDVVLTTYNMISSKHDDKKFFKNFSMNYVIYDEGHMLKNCSTERYRNLMKVKGQRKILLTGTPLQNNLIELISLMYFVMTKIFTKYCEDIVQLLSHFKQQGAALDSSGVVMYQRDRIDQAKQILQPYILRRLKAQVLSSLPPKMEEVIEIEMLPKQSENYEYILDTVRNLDGDSSNAYGALMRLRQAANHPLLRRTQYTEQRLDKIAKSLVAKEKPYEKKQWEHVSEDLAYMSDFQIHQLCEKFDSTQKYLLDESLVLESGKCKQLDLILPKIKEKGEKLLIFSQFTSMLDILEVYLKVRGHVFRRLDGSTPVMERQEMINEFNSDPELFIFLLSTKAGGLGINLTSANNIILHDIDFNPYNDKQAEDRCHRMGQKKVVYVTRFISKGTVEAGMLSLAKKKLQLEKQVTGGIKGQLEEDDDATRDSADSRDEKIDSKQLQKLLSSAIKHKPIEEDSPSSTP